MIQPPKPTKKRAELSLDVGAICPNCGHEFYHTDLKIVVVGDKIPETDALFHDVDNEGMPVEKKPKFLGTRRMSTNARRFEEAREVRKAKGYGDQS